MAHSAPLIAALTCENVNQALSTALSTRFCTKTLLVTLTSISQKKRPVETLRTSRRGLGADRRSVFPSAAHGSPAPRRPPDAQRHLLGLCSGAPWRNLPERFGPWSTVYQRFRDWRDDGTFTKVLERLHIRLREDGLIDLETWMIDSTSIRATRAAAGGGKKGATRTAQPCARAQSRRPDDQDPPAVRR